MPSYKIREAQKADNLTINNLIRDILSDYGFNNIEKDDDLNNIQSSYSHESECFLVAEYKDQIVATIALKRKSPENCELGRLYIKKG